MRKLVPNVVRFGIMLVLFVGLGSFVQPTKAAPNLTCQTLNGTTAVVKSFTNMSWSVTLQAGDTITATVTGASWANQIVLEVPVPLSYVAILTGPGPLPYTGQIVAPAGNFALIAYNGFSGAPDITVSFTCGPAGSSTTSAHFLCPIFWDGRLNNCDAGETFAVYCQPNGSVNVLGIHDGHGYEALTATPDEIAKAPSNPDFNTLIKTRGGVSLYRLHGGLLQVNRPEEQTEKMYAFAFSDCPKLQ